MEKSKVRAIKNRCGREIKAKTANGQNERRDEIKGGREGGGEAEKSILLRFVEETLGF